MHWVLALQNMQGLQLGWGEASPGIHFPAGFGIPQLSWLWKGERI